MVNLDLSKYSFGSNVKVEVICDFNITERCYSHNGESYVRIIQGVNRNRIDNNGKDICYYCSRRLKFSGRNNPNCKYTDLDDSFFKNIDTEFKAYLLGWIASDGHIHAKSNVIKIEISSRDIDILYVLARGLSKQLPVISRLREHNGTTFGYSRIQFCSEEIINDVCRHLNISRGKKSDKLTLPSNLIESKYFKDFLRGLFEGDGSIRDSTKLRKYFGCNITSGSFDLLKSIQSIFGGIVYFANKKNFCLPNHNKVWQIEMTFSSGKKFLNFIYNNCDPELKLNRKYDRYLGFKKHEELKFSLGKKKIKSRLKLNINKK